MKGYELIKEITEGKIKEYTQIEVHDLTVLDKVIAIIEYKNGRLNWVEGTFDTSYLVSLNCYFKIIEEQEEIDIQNIEEIEPAMNGNACVIDNKTWTLNQVIKAVKQLEREINKLKEKK